MSTKQTEALKLALEALERCDAALAEELAAWDIDPPLHHVLEASNACGPAITAIREALAEQPAQHGQDQTEIAFEAWWQAHGQFHRSKELAWNAWLASLACTEQSAQQEWPKPKFVRNVDGVPCITLVEHEYLMRSRTSPQPAYRAVKTFHDGKPVYVAEQPAQGETK